MRNAQYGTLPDAPVGGVKLRGDNTSYTCYGIDWQNAMVKIRNAHGAYEWVPASDVKFRDPEAFTHQD